MKSSTKVNFIAGVVVLAVLVSCTSMPAPTSESDTAFVIPVAFLLLDNTNNSDFFGYYRIRILHIADQTATYLDFSSNSIYGLVHGLPPGNYSIVEIAFHYGQGKLGTIKKTDVHFALEPKMITILDKTFVFKIAKAAIPGNFTMWGYFDPLTQGAAKDLILRLLKDVNFKRWNLSPATLANESITQAMSEVAGTADASP